MFLVFFLVRPVASADKPSDDVKKDAPVQSVQKMIWDYKEDIGLTDAQVTAIKEAISAFQKEVVRLRSKLQVVELDVQDLIQKKGKITLIKTKLKESADLQVEVRLADIETARKIDGILSAEQTKKWKEIQKREVSRRKDLQQPPPAKVQTPQQP